MDDALDGVASAVDVDWMGKCVLLSVTDMMEPDCFSLNQPASRCQPSLPQKYSGLPVMFVPCLLFLERKNWMDLSPVQNDKELVKGNPSTRIRIQTKVNVLPIQSMCSKRGAAQ